ncbi:MAG: PorT family protein, partial [Sphingobacteriaceae bacterium]|nr:PorT family protein [Sphingobacteriaceae bacterium]
SYTTIVKQNNDFHPVKAIIDSQDSAKTIIVAVVKSSAILNENLAINPANQSQTTNTQVKPTNEIGEAEEKLIKNIKAKRKIPISLAISAGPDLNSTSSIIGGKTSIAVGVGISVGLTKKLSLQTGLIYGSKNYTAEGYDYTFNNPNIPATIESIQALCKVLEIPLKASYLLNENKKRSIEFNAGLSSYLMLKENYVFKYTAASGRKDRTNQVVNANQHLFSVVELSATYNLKLKNKKFAFGIEPYVKIPLGGVGEGNILLKSSGVSLKLRYDINKKY